MANAPPSYDDSMQPGSAAAPMNAPYPPQQYTGPSSSTAPYPPQSSASYQAGATAAAGAPYPAKSSPYPPTAPVDRKTAVVSYPRPDQYEPPPPPSVYVPQAGSNQRTATTNTVIVSQPTAVVVPVNPFGYGPSTLRCPRCQQMTTTRLEYKTGGGTWVACAITALVGCWCGCCLIPFCLDGLKDVYHYCGECGQQIGIRKRM